MTENIPVPRPERPGLDYIAEGTTISDEAQKLGKAMRDLKYAIEDVYHFERKMIWSLDKLNAGLIWLKSIGRKK